MLSYFLLHLPYGLFLSGFPIKFCMHFLPPFAQYKRKLSNHSDLISQWTKNMKCLIKQFLQLPNAPRLVSRIFLSTLLSQFPSLCFFFWWDTNFVLKNFRNPTKCTTKRNTLPHTRRRFEFFGTETMQITTQPVKRRKERGKFLK